MVHDDSAKLPEVLAGLGVAAVAATATELVRRQRVAGIAIRPTLLKKVGSLVPAAIRDCVVLTRLAFAQLLRPQASRGRTVATPSGHEGDGPDENGRRAVGQALGSFAPSTIVIGMDPDRGVVIAHQLGGSGKPSELDPLGLA